MTARRGIRLSAITLGALAAVASLATMSKQALALVPDRMMLSPALKDSLPELYSASLLSVEFQNGIVQEGAQSSLKQMAAKYSKTAGSIAFVVRRPG